MMKMYALVKRIVTSLLEVCKDVLAESKSFNPSAETYQTILRKLSEIQKNLESVNEELSAVADAIKSEENKIVLPEGLKENKGIMALENVLQKRHAKGQTLHTLLGRYDRQTENITSQFEVKKETAALLSQLTLELGELEETLDFMSQASVDLSNVSFNKI